jgi:hypothetical protein
MAIHKITAPSAAQSDVPALIAGNVPLVRLSEALARAGLTARHDADRGVLVIEPAHAAGVKIPADAELGMRWWNGLAPARRRHWLDVAGSARPADAWAAFQSGRVAS